jgi:spermidine synthase
VILADACDRAGVAAELDSLTFYRNARACLAPGGVLVTNLCGDARSRAAHLAKLGATFDAEVLSLRMKPRGNIIALAFRDGRPKHTGAQLERRAVALKRALGLDLTGYARRFA